MTSLSSLLCLRHSCTQKESNNDDYGNNDMIYIQEQFFNNQANLDKYFEISFVLETFDLSGPSQATLVNVKYEKTNSNSNLSWPGFTLRRSGNNFQLTAKGATGQVRNVAIADWLHHRVTIYRRNRKVYFVELDGTEKMVYDFTNFTNYFEVPMTIGGSLDNEGVVNQPFRGFKGILSDITVKVER